MLFIIYVINFINGFVCVIVGCRSGKSIVRKAGVQEEQVENCLRGADTVLGAYSSVLHLSPFNAGRQVY